MTDFNKIFAIIPNSNPYFQQKPSIVCKDGFKVSIQAGAYMHSEPRLDYASEYTHFEIGFPSEQEPLLIAYNESDDGIYGYVPVEIINNILENHGGVLGYQTAEGFVYLESKKNKVTP